MPNHYELLYIIGAKMTEEEVSPLIEGVTNIIKEVGGEIKREENWGKRKLAYSIDRFQYGYYFLSVIDMEPEMVPGLNGQLRLNSDIIRYQIVKVKSIEGPKKPRPELEKSGKITYFGDDELENPEKMSEGGPKPKAPMASPELADIIAETAPADIISTEETTTTPADEEKPAEEAKSAKVTRKKKISIEELDQKIDEILKV